MTGLKLGIKENCYQTLVHIYDHLGDTMKDLHWLPISYRIQYKILLLVYKCLNGMGPDYFFLNFFFYINNH